MVAPEGEIQSGHLGDAAVGRVVSDVAPDVIEDTAGVSHDQFMDSPIPHTCNHRKESECLTLRPRPTSTTSTERLSDVVQYNFTSTVDVLVSRAQQSPSKAMRTTRS